MGWTGRTNKERIMKRSAVITIALLLAALSKARGAECDNTTKVTENRRVVLPERVHSNQYARRGFWLQNTGDNGVLCAVGAKTKRRLLPGEVWEEKTASGYLSGDLAFSEVSCVTSHGGTTLKGCDY
jgi:hypothetical protein